MKNIISLLFVSVFIFSCSDKKDGKNPLPKIEELSSQDSLLKNQLPDTITGENHSMIMDMILGKPKFQIKSIGILVYDGVNDLDFMGPRYVFGQSGVRPKLIALKPGTFKTVMGEEPRYVKLPSHFKIALFNNDNYCSYDDAMGNNAVYIITRVFSPEEIFNPDITEAIKYTLEATSLCLEGEENLLRAAVICNNTNNIKTFNFYFVLNLN